LFKEIRVFLGLKLLETNISHLKVDGKMIFLFHRWDISVSGKLRSSPVFSERFCFGFECDSNGQGMEEGDVFWRFLREIVAGVIELYTHIWVNQTVAMYGNLGDLPYNSALLGFSVK